MSLVGLLEIESTRLPGKCAFAVRYCELLWQEKGCPAEVGTLAEFLDGALKRCIEFEYQYPKMFLKRLKQLQRGEWEPASPVLQ